MVKNNNNEKIKINFWQKHKTPTATRICLSMVGILVIFALNKNNNEPDISPYRPQVYTNGFPILALDVDFALPIDWDQSGYDLQIVFNNWLGATLNVSNTSDKFEMTDVEVLVRGRGNSTWWSFWEKRPMRFRFPDDQWQAMFDSPHVGRDWVLFANAADPSHLRNFSAFYLANLLGNFSFTPQTWFVHLYLDGDYRGVYLLLDEREAIEGRGNLNLDIDPTISEYMLEFDVRTGRYAEGRINTHWVNVRGSWDIRYPNTSEWMSEPNNPHALYVKDFLTRIDTALTQGDIQILENLIDIDSFVDFYLIHEFLKNQDSRWSSLFFQIKGQEDERRLHAGPIWDFDLSTGSTPDVYNTTGSHAVRNDSSHYVFDWFYHLMNTQWFQELARNRWNDIKDDQIAHLMNRINYMVTTFETEFIRDYQR